MKSIDMQTVFQLNSNVLIRYEHNFQDGTMILYDVEREELWLGNSACRGLIKLINGQNKLNEIYTELLLCYDSLESTKVIESFNFTIEDLYNRKFIEKVD